jgi:hypothetical protein
MFFVKSKLPSRNPSCSEALKKSGDSDSQKAFMSKKSKAA